MIFARLPLTRCAPPARCCRRSESAPTMWRPGEEVADPGHPRGRSRTDDPAVIEPVALLSGRREVVTPVAASDVHASARMHDHLVARLEGDVTSDDARMADVRFRDLEFIREHGTGDQDQKKERRAKHHNWCSRSGMSISIAMTRNAGAAGAVWIVQAFAMWRSMSR